MKASVLVMTYNHAEYIRQALDSVLMQRSVDFEVLISEDCSADGTREIVCDYQRRFPSRIRLLLSERNIRSNQIVTRGIEAARGEYIALLDGDDYWIADDKLKKQAAFLDRNPQCSMCFHNAKARFEGAETREWNWTPANHPEISSFEDIWMGNSIATCSTMFRRGLVEQIPSWYTGFFPITDWPLHILHAEKGPIGYLNEVMGVYRLHRGGYFSPLSEREKLLETLKFYRRMNECLDFKYDALAKTAIAKYFIEWVEEFLSRGDLESARECYRYYLAGKPVNRYVTKRRMIKTTVRTFVPQTLLPRKYRTARSPKPYSQVKEKVKQS